MRSRENAVLRVPALGLNFAVTSARVTFLAATILARARLFDNP
jgi:hypothetical protein